MKTLKQVAREYARKVWHISRDYASVRTYSEEDFIAGYNYAKDELTKQINTLDRQLNIIHDCLADLYEYKYNNERERIDRIKEALNKMEE